MALVSKPTGTLKIKDATALKYYTVNGVNSTLESETAAATQLNKIFAIANLSVVGDENTKFYIEKGVVADG